MADQPPLPAISRLHLAELTGGLGIWQHATGTVPVRRLGYCTDDEARAVVVHLLHGRELGWAAVRTDAWRSLRFLRDAWSPVVARFRNFRDAEGAWMDQAGSEDTQGRALLALGRILAEPRDPAFAADARMLFANAVPATRRLGALRAMASCALGCAAALGGDTLGVELTGVTKAALRDLVGRLMAAFEAGGATADWPWPEALLSYENALIPHALIAGGSRLGDTGSVALGLRVLRWLTVEQRADGGWLSPVGNDGWWPRGGVRAQYDQQPIEAASQLFACEAAFEATSDPGWLAAAEQAYAWFLGINDSGVPVAVPETGGCHDGLEPTGVNPNQGAESTLMWLTALEHMRGLRGSGARGGASLSDMRAQPAPHG